MNGHKTLYKVQILCTANANSKIHETLIGNSNDQFINKTTNVNEHLNAQ